MLRRDAGTHRQRLIRRHDRKQDPRRTRRGELISTILFASKIFIRLSILGFATKLIQNTDYYVV